MRVYEIGTGIAVASGKRTRRVFAALKFCDEKDAHYFWGHAGRPYMGEWKTVSFRLDKPNLPVPDLLICGAGWVCSERAMEIAGDAMKIAGEFLPVQIKGIAGNYHYYHITNLINALDASKSEWDSFGRTKTTRQLLIPLFKPDQFGNESLFHIPENAGARAYVLERNDDANDSGFKALVDRHQLTGLRFDLIWADKVSCL